MQGGRDTQKGGDMSAFFVAYVCIVTLII